MSRAHGTITHVLAEYQSGDEEALSRLMPLVYDHLRRIARRQIFAPSAKRTISPTVLVHELFLRLEKSEPLQVKDRRIFYVAAARCMRQILVDYSRRRGARKRGGGLPLVSLHEDRDGGPAPEPSVDALNDALDALSRLDSELARIVELRYLVGLSVEEVADVLGVNARTVKRRWATAKAWLQREISK